MACGKDGAVWCSGSISLPVFADERYRRGPARPGQIGEVAAALFRGKYRCLAADARLRLTETGALVGKEKEGVILPDRAADSTAKLMLMENWRRLLKQVAAVHKSIPVELEG